MEGRQPATEKGATLGLFGEIVSKTKQLRHRQMPCWLKVRASVALAKTIARTNIGKTNKQKKQNSAFDPDALKLGKSGAYIGKIILQTDSGCAKKNVEIHT